MAEERPWNKDLLDKIINHEIICFNKTRKHSTSMPTFSGMESYLSSVNKQIFLCSCVLKVRGSDRHINLQATILGLKQFLQSAARHSFLVI